jgi:hypothetical protein
MSASRQPPSCAADQRGIRLPPGRRPGAQAGHSPEPRRRGLARLVPRTLTGPAVVAQIRVETGPREGWVTVWRAEAEDRVRLVTTNPGPAWCQLWAFSCPRCSAAVRGLYLPPFELEFACRTSHCIGYASQTPGRLGCPAGLELWRAPRFAAAAVPAELPRHPWSVADRPPAA